MIQIKGRRGLYTNITVPLKHRKTVGKSVIQKKAGDSLPFITSIPEAMAWWKFACHRDLLLTIVKQKISVAGLDSELAEQLRELLTPTDDASSEWLVEQEE